MTDFILEDQVKTKEWQRMEKRRGSRASAKKVVQDEETFGAVHWQALYAFVVDTTRKELQTSSHNIILG